MATDSMLCSSESNGSYTSSQADSARTFVVAISGCSSSGKTLLSLLLKSVFTDVNICDSGIANSPEASQPLIIHEDDYFKAKSNCPIVTFETTMTDRPFILKSLNEANPGPYQIHQDNKIPAVDDIHSQSAIPEKQLLCEVTGPDTDCWEAVDIPALFEALEAVKTTGVLKEYHQKHTGLQDSQADVDRWTNLIQEMQQLVKQRIANIANKDAITDTEMKDACLETTSNLDLNETRFELPALCFIEGFLLYTDPNAAETAQIPSMNEVDSIDNNAATRHDILGNAQSFYNPLTPDSIPPERTSTCAEKEALLDNFDIKLFLSTSKDTAKARRFSRKPYIDYPLGGRLVGQHWKTEGYFDGVAWPNYEKLHGWLLLDGKGKPGDVELEREHSKKGDVHVREVDAGVEDTLRWAVNVILAEMCKNA